MFVEEVGRFWQAEMAMRDEFNVGLRCLNVQDTTKVFVHFDSRTVVMEVQNIESKECVTTHLPNGRKGCDAAFGVSLSESASRANFCGRSGPFLASRTDDEG